MTGLQVYAFLEYMDDVLGRLFAYLEQNSMLKDTYVSTAALMNHARPPKMCRSAHLPALRMHDRGHHKRLQVFFTSDNGSELFPMELLPKNRPVGGRSPCTL